VQYCLSEKPRVLSFEPEKTCQQTYPITEYQPVYFITPSFDDAKKKLKEFAQKIPRKFGVRYNPYTQRIEVIERKEQLVHVLKQVKNEIGVLEESLVRLQESE
jgi:phenylalanine-4-hydroxylase